MTANSDPNVNFNFPQDFLDAFHATRGLCPASPEGDYAFMFYLLALCEEYHGTAAPPAAATIDSISPDTAPAGGPDITLTITGTGLKYGSTVHFGLAVSPLVYVSETEGMAQFAAAGYASPGTIPVGVEVKGMPMSNTVDFIAT